MSESRLTPLVKSVIGVRTETPDKQDEQNLDDEECVYFALMDELINQYMWKQCMLIDRSIKLGYFEMQYQSHFTNSTSFGQEATDASSEIESSSNPSMCPACHKPLKPSKTGPDAFTHLVTCMSASGTARGNMSRQAKRNDPVTDCYEGDEDFDIIPPKKKPKKKAKKKQCGIGGKALMSQNINVFQNLSASELKEFLDNLDNKCGVVSKKSKIPCQRTKNCPQHTDTEREDIRKYIADLVEQQSVKSASDITTSHLISIDTSTESSQPLDESSFNAMPEPEILDII